MKNKIVILLLSAGVALSASAVGSADAFFTEVEANVTSATAFVASVAAIGLGFTGYKVVRSWLSRAR